MKQNIKKLLLLNYISTFATIIPDNAQSSEQHLNPPTQFENGQKPMEPFTLDDKEQTIHHNPASPLYNRPISFFTTICATRAMQE